VASIATDVANIATDVANIATDVASIATDVANIATDVATSSALHAGSQIRCIKMAKLSTLSERFGNQNVGRRPLVCPHNLPIGSATVKLS
jgi:hypothetical protein